MTYQDGFAAKDPNQERVRCLVEQGFTPSLAQSVLSARDRSVTPVTIWIVDNSSSMLVADGKRLVETESQTDVRLVPCTRWDELVETIRYHAQLSALLEAPTKFILLNNPSMGSSKLPREYTIAERGEEWIQQDLDHFMTSFKTLRPHGVTPLTMHLRRIYQSIKLLDQKAVLVLATDGRPTDTVGNTSPAVDRDFEIALKQVQSKAWVVIRLCTDDPFVMEYYQRLDDEMELSLEILDDYLDEAKEVYKHNPWLNYSLCLHRCREMGISCHAEYRWFDWLDERTLTKPEIYDSLMLLGISGRTRASSLLNDPMEWKSFCDTVGREQKQLASQYNEAMGGMILQAFQPWHPIWKRPSLLVDISKLRNHGQVDVQALIAILIILIGIAFFLIQVSD